MKPAFILLILSISSVVQATQMAITVQGIGQCKYDDVEKLIEQLRKYKVPEVHGFLDGFDIEFDNMPPKKSKFYKRAEEAIRLWIAKGHALGNEGHAQPYGKGWFGASLFFDTIPDIKAHIEKNEPDLRKFGGDKNWKYFRHSDFFIVENSDKQIQFRKLFKELGYKFVPVTLKGTIKFDSKYNIIPNAQAYVEVLVKMFKDAEKMSQALFGKSGIQIFNLSCVGEGLLISDEILSALQKEGVEFVTLDRALRDEMYQFDVLGVDFFPEVISKKNPGIKAKDIRKELDCRYGNDLFCKKPSP